jgi:hypothetical protein
MVPAIIPKLASLVSSLGTRRDSQGLSLLSGLKSQN